MTVRELQREVTRERILTTVLDLFADDELIERAGLRPSPLRLALRGLQRHPELADVTRLADLPLRIAGRAS